MWTSIWGSKHAPLACKAGGIGFVVRAYLVRENSDDKVTRSECIQHTVDQLPVAGGWEIGLETHI